MNGSLLWFSQLRKQKSFYFHFSVWQNLWMLDEHSVLCAITVYFLIIFNSLPYFLSLFFSVLIGCLSICLSNCLLSLSSYLSILLSNCLLVFLSINLSVCLSFCMPLTVQLLINLSIYLFNLPVSLLIAPLKNLSIDLFKEISHICSFPFSFLRV